MNASAEERQLVWCGKSERRQDLVIEDYEILELLVLSIGWSLLFLLI
jgi:hypothetical protein